MLRPGPDDQRCRISIEQAKEDVFGQYDELLEIMQPDDELWEVCTSKQSWDELMGWHYIELCRDGKTVSQIILSMN